MSLHNNTKNLGLLKLVLLFCCGCWIIITMNDNFLYGKKFRIRHEQMLDYMRGKALHSGEGNNWMNAMMEGDTTLMQNQALNYSIIENNTNPYTFYLNTNIPTTSNASSLNCTDISNPCTKGSQILNYFYENLVYKTSNIDIYVIGNLTDCFDGTDRTNVTTANLLTLRLIGQNPNQYSFMNCKLRLLFTNVYFQYFNIHKYDVKNLNTVGFSNCFINSVKGDTKIETGMLVIRNTVVVDSNFETISVMDIDGLVMNRCDLKVVLQDLYMWKSRVMSLNTINNSVITDSSIELNRLNLVVVKNTRFERSEFTAVYVSALEMDNCTVVETKRWLRLKGTVLLSLVRSVISNSPYDSSSKGVIESLLSSYIHINECIFKNNNNRALYVEETGFVNVRSSSFFNNLGAIHVGEIVDLGDLLTGVHVFSSVFSRNFGANGGGIVLPNTTTEIYKCEFYANTAQKGGAIYANAGHLEVWKSIFEDNQAYYASGCSLLNCGRGGAIYAQDPVYLNIDASNTFQRNIARDGGALYVEILSDTFWKSWFLILNCLGNMATFYGNCFYSKQSMNTHNFLRILNNSPNALASSKLTVVDLYPKVLSVYPGQEASIKLTIMDGFNNTLQKMQTPPRLLISDSGITFQTVFENTTFITSLHVSNESITSITAIISLEDETIANLAIEILPCPNGYSLVKYSASATSKKLCLKNPDPPLHIILPAVFSSIILFIVGILLGISIIYLGWNVMDKLKRLKKKEKAEQYLAQRLVDRQVVFADETELGNSTDHLKTSLLGSYYSNSQGSSSSGKNRKMKEKIRIQGEKNYLIPIENIEIVRKLAEGANGIVYLGKWLGTEVAMKSLKLEYITEEENEEFEKEAALLKSLKHPNIVTSFGVCMSGNVKYMVVEYMSKGSLDRAIYQSRTGAQILKLQHKVNILVGVANGMNYLHSLKPYSIIHRDLKPGNILLDQNLSSKVADFGLCKIIGGNSTNTMTTALGTLFYMR